MLGSTFIFDERVENLCALADDLDAIADLAHVDMDVLATIDFETLVGDSGFAWTSGEPIVFDEAKGLGIFLVDPQALAHVLMNSGDVDAEQAADFARLHEFVAAHGLEHVYELATF